MNANGTRIPGSTCTPGGSEPVSTRSIFAFIPSYLRSFALKPCFAQGGRRAGLARERHADARSAVKLRRTPDRSADAHRLVGVSVHKPDHRCSIVLSTQPLEKTAKQFNWFSDPCRKFVANCAGLRG